LAFVSLRDGVSRVWLKRLTEGSEVPLTSGSDFSPRFSPDGSAILFTREEENGMRSLYRVPVLGGEPRKVVHDAVYGDWSPDGREIAFVRLGEDRGVTGTRVGLSSIDGANERVIQTVGDMFLRYPRFSPDGKWIGCIGAASNTPWGGRGFRIMLVPTGGSVERRLRSFEEGGLISAMGWLGSGEEIIYSQWEFAGFSVAGGSNRLDTGSNRFVLQNIETGEGKILFWSSSPSRVLDVVGSGRIVYESTSLAHHLREFEIPSRPEARGTLLSQGTSRDRQPVYSPDGEWLAYSSNRVGSVDIWIRSTRDGSVRRLTDHPTVDHDPGFTPDSSKIIFSSRRGGNFEIWMTNLDGSGVRQVTRDPEHTGIWKVRADGSDATLLVPGSCVLPEVSPDGQYVSYVKTRQSGLNVIRVARVEDGERLPIEIPLPGSDLGNGRSRWMPDGRAIAFTWTVGTNSGIFTQEFVPDADTSGTRRPLIEFGVELLAESFAIFPDERRITVATMSRSRSLMGADNLSGVTPPSR
jgi:Tol biopolymer transport system component